MRDPIPLRLSGKREMLQKIDLMEDQYGEPMMFDESRILAHVVPMAAGTEVAHGDTVCQSMV